MIMASPFDLSGKVAVITGSTRGIGRAIAEAMARAGAKVVISSRKADRCDEVASELLNEGLDATSIPCHIGKKEDLERLVGETHRHFGPIDCLVLNAAVNPYYGPISRIPDEAFSKIIDTNVRSSLWLCNLVIPQMAERGVGSVIFVASTAGLRGSSRLGMYGVSKAAGLQLVRNLAVEWGPRNIRVNAIAPGLVRTDFARALWQDPELLAQARAACPLGRIGDPQDIAGAAVFLASPAAAWITGQTLIIDGGATIVGL
jgi:NAD(P)-dependent dehydrogenase (short-subunit alcohol dehydrogenase family)